MNTVPGSRYILKFILDSKNNGKTLGPIHGMKLSLPCLGDLSAFVLEPGDSELLTREAALQRMIALKLCAILYPLFRFMVDLSLEANGKSLTKALTDDSCQKA